MNTFEKFLIFCSGAYLPLVRRCPASAHQFVGIGATVAFTAIFAGISMGHALSWVFSSIWTVLGISLIWMLMIFNLDRFIVSTLRKDDRMLPELKQVFPRFMLALLLALVIAKPLELRIFEKEINRELDEQRLQMIKTSRAEIAEGFPEIGAIEKQIADLNEEIVSKESFRNQKQVEYDQERFGVKTEGTTGLPGIGINAEKKERQLDNAEEDFLATQEINRNKISVLEEEIQRLNAIKMAEFQNQQESMDDYNGLAARLQAFDALTKKNSTLFWANWLILLLFATIEMAPVLVKLLAAKGSYEQLLAYHESGILLAAEEQWYKKSKEGQLRREVFDELYPRKKSQRIAGETIW